MDAYREVSMNNIAISGHQFALIRVVLGLYLLCHFVGLWPHAIEMFSNEGMFVSQSILPTLDAIPIYSQSQILLRWFTAF